LRLQGLQSYCKKKIFLFIFFVIISLNAQAFYSACKSMVPNYKSQIQVDRSSWLPIVLIGIVSCFVIVGIMYGLGKAINSSELVAIASNNVYQNFAILILVLLVFVYQNFEEKFFEAFGKSSGNAINETKEYLTKVWCYSMGVFVSTLGANTAIQAGLEFIKSKGSFGFGFFRFSWEELKNEISNPLKDPFQSVLAGVMAAVVITNIQIFIVDNVYLIFSLFIIIGAVCRVAPFLRNFGNALIAIAIGLYIFYPLTISMVIEKTVEGYYHYKTGNPGGDWYKNPMAGATVGAIYQGISTTSMVLQFVDKTAKDFLEVLNFEKVYDVSIGKLKNKIISLFDAYPILGNIKNGVRALYNVVFIPLLVLSALHLMLDCGTFAILILGGVLPAITIVIVFGITREIGNLLGSDLTFETIFRIL
jgi:hypothetical protein